MKARSPEEYMAATLQTIQEELLTPKVDVYSLGNSFYTILIKERVFRHDHSKDAQMKVRQGDFPIISDDRRLRFTDMEFSIYKAMKMCHVLDVDERSSAKEVEEFLRGEMTRFNVSFY